MFKKFVLAFEILYVHKQLVRIITSLLARLITPCTTTRAEKVKLHLKVHSIQNHFVNQSKLNSPAVHRTVYLVFLCSPCRLQVSRYCVEIWQSIGLSQLSKIATREILTRKIPIRKMPVRKITIRKITIRKIPTENRPENANLYRLSYK